MFKAQSGTGESTTQFNFDEIMTRQINAQEHKVGKNNALISLVSGLVEMDLDPAALVVLLDLNRFLLEPLQVLDLFDPTLERCFATIVENSGDYGAANAKELVP